MDIIDKINHWKIIKKELQDELNSYFDDIEIVDEIPKDAIGSEEDGYYMDMCGCTEEMAVLYVLKDKNGD